jgi:SAM-dependent methyltransferase
MGKETSEVSNNQKTRAGINSEYVFNNALPEAESRFGLLSKLFDERTIHYIEQRGIRAGWSCLEVGGGGGSIAAFLCSRAGDAGRVLATDIDPRFLQGLTFPNLEVRQHDIRSEPLPEQEFDLVHARLLLTHVAERETALKRMVAALKPGGWIVLEEFDHLAVLPNPEVDSPDEALKLRDAFQQVLTARGVDMHYGRLLARRLNANGLVKVGAEAYGSMWKSGSAGISLLKLNCEGLRETIIGSSLMTESDFEADMKRIDEPDFLIASPVMFTAWGQLGGG